VLIGGLILPLLKIQILMPEILV